jgi:hypothetical protein
VGWLSKFWQKGAELQHWLVAEHAVPLDAHPVPYWQE